MDGADGAERRRLLALQESGVLEAGSEEAFDRLTRLAARLCEAPIARVSFVDADRQVFKSAIGPLPPSGHQTPLSHAICKLVADGGDELLITDARADPRVADSAAVREHGVAAYAGEPLWSATGECVGALCVVDEQPREWTEKQLSALRDLAAAANTEIRLLTTLRRAQEAVEQLDGQARLLDLTADAVVVRDARTDVVSFWNAGAERLYGRTAEQAIGQTMDSLFAGEHTPDAGAWREAIHRVGHWQGELRRRRAGGGHVVVLSRQTVDRDAAGNSARILEVDTDVTEQRELAARLRQAEKMEALGQLAGGVAHDFNNLLTAINGYCELAQDRIPGTVTELDEIARAGDRAAELTRRLLAFSRRQDLQPSEIDLDDVTRDLVPLLRRLIGEHVKVAVRSSDGPTRVMADRAQLEQVILNLAVNARDAMPHGGTLTIETHGRERAGRFRRADEAGGPPDAFVCLVVRDTGVGIAPDMVDHVFEPFFTTKEEGYGTGLGLATVYGIVTQSGGDVRIDSEPGSGTAVTVTLPAAEGATASASSGAGERGALGGTETILVCEDEPTILGLVERMLKRLGYTVLTASHPAEALEVAGAHPGRIDALISDIVMPDMLGTELAVRLESERPGLRVLLTSGYTADALGETADRPPGTQFLSKPFQRSELIASLRGLLDAPARVATTDAIE